MSTKKNTRDSKSSFEKKSFKSKPLERKTRESKARVSEAKKPKPSELKSKNTDQTQTKKSAAKTLNASQKKYFRTIGHKLNPVVILGDSGLSDNVKKELNRALEDHELIKIKIPAGERSEKQKLIDSLCKSSQCTLVQKVGNVVLLYRAAKKPNPKLSNILKNQSF